MVLVLGAIGARSVHDDGDGFVVGVLYVADLAERAEELGGDVGENAGTLGGDAIADEEKQEPGEELVDLIGGVEFGELIEKFDGKIHGVGRGGLRLGVAETKSGVRVRDGKLAAAAVVGVMAATGASGGAGFGSLVVHFRFLDWGDRGYTPPWQ
jgi:hypothetical protein